MKTLFTLGVSAVILSGCASILGDSQNPVAITSEPAGASFEVRDSAGRMIHSGTTPGTVTLKTGAGYFKGADYSVLVKKDGFNPQTTTLTHSISGWYWGNILFGGLIGLFAVDPATGAMYKLPEATNVALVPLALSTPVTTSAGPSAISALQ